MCEDLGITIEIQYSIINKIEDLTQVIISYEIY